jgi:hypothetical protein
MKEDKKFRKQKIYRLRIYKDFEFPSFSINKHNKLKDLSQAALETLKENSKNDNMDDYFSFEIIQELPFSIREEEVIPSTGNIDYDYIVREIALEHTKEKYGELDPQINPSLFKVSEKTSISITYNLIREIEIFYITQIQKYNTLIADKIVIK